MSAEPAAWPDGSLPAVQAFTLRLPELQSPELLTSTGRMEKESRQMQPGLRNRKAAYPKTCF